MGKIYDINRDFASKSKNLMVNQNYIMGTLETIVTFAMRRLQKHGVRNGSSMV